MKHKTIIYASIILAVFIGLVFYNYFKAQKALQETREAPLSISLVSFPEKIKKNVPGNFVWHIEASSDLATSFTTIYWSYESSPSALTKKDSPDAVYYLNSQSDYASGLFKLPDDFDVNISFPKAGRVWFRSYAKVREDHLWSEEKYLDVTN